VLAFDLAEKYRCIAIVMADGSVGQMMEPAELPEMRPVRRFGEEWAVTGAKNRKPHVLSSIFIDPPAEEKYNIRIMNRWMEIQKNEVRIKEYYLDDAEFAVIGFGTAGRVALSAVRAARQQGIKVGLLRPITVSPYPFDVVDQLTSRVKGILVVEMNTGQMLDDVRLSVKGRVPIEFYGRPGGMVPMPDEILNEIHHLIKHGKHLDGDPRHRWLQRINSGEISLL
jgi:2-oxoglutarate ferredoxin oxidoreductase subunit alpha